MIFRTAGLGLAVLAGAAGAARAQTLEPFVASANLNWPVGITHAGDGSGRLFLTGQNGVIWVHDGSQLRDEPFLDISPLVRFQPLQGEEGLVGTAFHPSYETNGLFYVFYTNPAGDNVVARYRVSATNGNVADAASAAILLTIPHTASAVHNGGQLQFGPDGYLYVASGDGGRGGDPSENAQNLGVLLGKILRLDVDGPAPYGIPPTNPFVGVPGVRPEIWAYGLRNPWRFSFDRQTGDLFIGDVGEARREEIDFQPAGVGGLNYGWDDMEGTLCYEPLTGCLTRNRVLPILEHDHASGDCAVVGGYRYRGTQVAGLPGKYVYGDFCSQRIHVAREGPPGQWTVTQEILANFNISALGEDEAGELYVARYQSGSSIYRLVGVTPSINVFPEFDAIEGTGGTSQARVPIRLGPTLQTVTARYETLPSTALPGQDYVPVSGALTFPPSHDEQVQEVVVPLVPDAVPEDLESFRVRLFDAVDAQPADQQDYVHIFDDDPPPAFRVDDAASLEGDGPLQVAVPVRVWPRSPDIVVVQYATVAGSATPGADFQPTSGSLTFFPGASGPQNVVVGLPGDRRVEGDETFSIVLSSPVGAGMGDAEGTVTIVDDDAPPLSNVEAGHGTTLRADLSDGQADFYRLAQEPRSSYEAILDEVSGDASPGLVLSRVGTDNLTTLQSAAAVGGGSALTLRWQNATASLTTGQHLRVGSPSCGTGCGADDTYRLRVRETTASIARFNSFVSQATMLVLQNAGAEPLTGTLSFWSPEGELLGQYGLVVGSHGSLALNAANVPGVAGRSGSITIAHDGAYGALTGKAVALEPSTGFSFDSPIQNRAR